MSSVPNRLCTLIIYVDAADEVNEKENQFYERDSYKTYSYFTTKFNVKANSGYMSFNEPSCIKCWTSLNLERV